LYIKNIFGGFIELQTVIELLSFFLSRKMS